MHRSSRETDKRGSLFEFLLLPSPLFIPSLSSVQSFVSLSLALSLGRNSHRRICVAQQHITVMDWEGQKLSEQLMQIMLVAFAVLAFATGYTLGSFQTMLLIYAAGVVLTTLTTVPNWPFFNRHPLKWLDPIEAELHPKPPQISAPKKKPTKSHNK